MYFRRRGYVCADGFPNWGPGPSVVCRSLNYSRSVLPVTGADFGDSPPDSAPFVARLRCSTDASSVGECRSLLRDVSDCDDKATVICDAGGMHSYNIISLDHKRYLFLLIFEINFYSQIPHCTCVLAELTPQPRADALSYRTTTARGKWLPPISDGRVSHGALLHTE